MTRFQTLIATACGLGYVPYSPGTVASAATLPLAWFVGAGILPILALALFLIGWGAADAFVRRTGVEDSPHVVIDEVAGQCLALLPAPHDLGAFAVGFLAFRAADILKPWPVSWAERKLPGGLGVMADDLLAAVYAGLIVYLFVLWR